MDGRAVHPISWRQEFGGLKSDQVKRLKDLETENTRLPRAVSDLTLDKLYCRRDLGETTEPRAPPRLHRACSSNSACSTSSTSSLTSVRPSVFPVTCINGSCWI